ncbi:hypothetical protein [uncultured Aquimarina sp.]|uniref:hypothetical protein n=1 Tax=uncultured Aquimarina sp. TaxID=575652 RepID=UPI0026039FB1|nr:hypothetical protein [uncultured Aquimarina sp.]
MKLKVYFLICCVVISCKTRSDKSKNATTESNNLLEQDNNSIEKNKFSDYLKAIPFLELPYSTFCDDDYENPPELDQKLKKEYSGGDLEEPYRRIPNNQNLEIILNLTPADVLLPIVKIYYKSGDLKASQQLFFGYCGGEPGYYHKEYITINPDLIIEHIDSTWTHKVDSLEIEIKGTEKLEVETYKYEISKTGEIKKIK